VLLRELTERGILESRSGKVAVGWLIVEDLIMVIALVLLPAVAGPLGGAQAGAGGAGSGSESIAASLALTLGKVALFVALMLFGGVRAIPWLLRRVEQTGSRELFILATLVVSLSLAYVAAALFGVSFALGAFLAGVVVNESDLSHRAAEEALPLREAFAVLFFVSVGMLIEPSFVVAQFGALLAVLAIVTIGKGLVGLLLVRLFGGSLRTGLVVAAGLAQIGEFSFILADAGFALGLLPEEGRKLILASALFSITLNPLLFRLAETLANRLDATPQNLTAMAGVGRSDGA